MKDIYKLVFDAWNADSIRFWTVFSVMSTINGGAFAVIAHGSAFAEKSTSGPTEHSLTSIAIGGALFCVLWLCIQWRYVLWCAWWDGKLAEVEKIYLEDINAERRGLGLKNLPSGFQIFGDRRLKSLQLDGVLRWIPWQSFSTRLCGASMAVLFLAAWVALAIISR